MIELYQRCLRKLILKLNRLYLKSLYKHRQRSITKDYLNSIYGTCCFGSIVDRIYNDTDSVKENKE